MANKGNRDPVLLQACAPQEGIPTEVCDFGKEAALPKSDNWGFLQSEPPLSPVFI